MSNDQEKKQILLMLQEGKVTAEQAEKLLKALEQSEKRNRDLSISTPERNSNLGSGIKGKFKVEVQSSDGDNVVVTLPLMLAKLALTMMPSDKMNEIKSSGIDLEQIVNNIEDFVDMVDEDIVNVESADGDRVRIYIQR